VTDPAQSSLSAGAPLLLSAPGLAARCVAGCELPESGGPATETETALLITGFSGASAASDFSVDVDGAAGTVSSLEPDGETPGLLLRVMLPAVPGGLAGPSRAALLRVAAAWDGALVAHARVRYWRAPRVASARFDAAGAVLVFTTDQVRTRPARDGSVTSARRLCRA
jgi:hypothetical protein